MHLGRTVGILLGFVTMFAALSLWDDEKYAKNKSGRGRIRHTPTGWQVFRKGTSG